MVKTSLTWTDVSQGDFAGIFLSNHAGRPAGKPDKDEWRISGEDETGRKFRVDKRWSGHVQSRRHRVIMHKKK